MKQIPADGKKSSVLRALLLCSVLSALCGGLCFAAFLKVWGILAFVFTGFFLLGAALFALLAPPEEADPEKNPEEEPASKATQESATSPEEDDNPKTK